MIGLSQRISAAALFLLGAAGSLGCELVATVDRSQIPETGVGGQGTGGMGTTGGTGGMGGSGGTGGTGGGTGGTGGGTGGTGGGTGGTGGGTGGTGGTGGSGGTGGAVCGDGVTAGAEACDDGNTTSGDGCDVGCEIEPGFTCDTATPNACSTTCGDGIKAGAEACDDGNKTDLDGCSNVCKIDVFTEQEPNGTTAQANGPYDHAVLIHGAVQPATDFDFFAIQLPATADLRLETFDSNGPGSCANIDTVVTLYGTDGTTVIASDDDSGLGACSRLDPKKAAALRHLPAGTYYARVETYNQYKTIPGYSLVVSFDALCGDGQKQGAEECDGTPGCTATCDRTPVCGDGFVDGAEECDDGNTTSGDGCSATCQYEVLAEKEPNDTPVSATGPFQPNVLLGGAVNPATDADYFAIQLPATADLRLETFDATGPSNCNAIDTLITLYGTDGVTALISRDQGGVNNCSRIDPARAADKAAAHLPAGTYYVKVESALNGSVIPGYTLLATYGALCGNGVIEGAEECDGGPGCTATCDRVAVCGDGFVDGAETCDDGDTTSGDGCSATCQLELITESEANDTAATANGPYATHALIQGAISPGADVDYYAIQLNAVSDVRLETFDGNGPGSCDGVDTVLTLYAADGTTVLATQDDGGIGACSKIDPKDDAGARRLAAGTYFVKVEDFSNDTAISAYRLEISFVAVCGDGKVEGSEECDGTPNCDASCNRIPTCGDGLVDAPETCDDGNTTDGDGCSATCQLESVAEVEPNDTTAEADAAAVIVTGNATIAGSIGAVGDEDLFRVDLAQAGVVRFETLDPGGDSCTIATTLRLFDGGGAQLYADDNSGISSCSALVLGLAAGTYYAGVEQQGNTAAIPSYLLQVRVEQGAATEAEPNDTKAAATAVSGSEVFVIGGHQSNADTDFFAITVPPGKSVRAEVIEGSSAETCESLDLDSYLTLYDASGVAVAQDDDSGRGFCSRIDGTGASPASPGASKLAGGTYYLAVEAAPFAQNASDTAGQFDYRLVITIR